MLFFWWDSSGCCWWLEICFFELHSIIWLWCFLLNNIQKRLSRVYSKSNPNKFMGCQFKQDIQSPEIFFNHNIILSIIQFPVLHKFFIYPHSIFEFPHISWWLSYLMVKGRPWRYQNTIINVFIGSVNFNLKTIPFKKVNHIV